MSSDKRYMENLCFRLKMQGLSDKEMVKETGLNKSQINRKLSDYGKRSKGDTSNIGSETIKTSSTKKESFDFSSIISDFESKDTQVPLEDTLTKEDDYFTLPDGKDKSLFLHKNSDRQRENIKDYIEKKHQGKEVKVLYMADLHIPFTMYDLVKHIINEHKDADILVINGDLLDLFAVSTFAKDKAVALKRELQEGREFLEIVSKVFSDVIITEGNHERRLRNYIKHVIPVDMHFLFPEDPLQVIQQGSVFNLKPLKNVHVVGSWWINLWDTIIGHPDNYNAPPMRTVMNASEHFMLVKQIPHKAMIIGHTHQAGWLMDRGRLLMETGCLNHDMDYRNGSKFIKTAWTRAHAVFYFDDEGNNRINDSELTIFPI